VQAQRIRYAFLYGINGWKILPVNKIWARDIKSIYLSFSLFLYPLYIEGGHPKRKENLRQRKDFYFSFLCMYGNARERKDI